MSRPAPDQWLTLVLQDQTLTPVQRAVAAALWWHMDKHGVCFPNLETIGKYAGVTRRQTVRLALNVLVDRGHIARDLQPKGRLSPNQYRAKFADFGSRGSVERTATVVRLAHKRKSVERTPQRGTPNGPLTIHGELGGDTTQRLSSFLDELELRRGDRNA